MEHHEQRTPKDLPKLASSSPGRAVRTPTFELHTLGWRGFQDLCIAVLREVWGQSVQAFADTRDGGRDGAFYGVWDSAGCKELPTGPFVIQCKFTARRDETLTLSSVQDELEKIEKLVRQGICSSYVLLSNARLTGTSEAAIRKAIESKGATFSLVLGENWLNQTIALNQRLRMFVPRVYGLGDLSQILDERAYGQASALLEYLRDDLSTFVVTDAYRRAASAVADHGFCLLLGEPAVGKSVIAATLAMTALDQWKCATIRADGPDSIVEHWNPHEPNQFFWVDDAFGAVRHERSLTDSWSRRIPKVMAAIKGGAKVILTSRDYIYREARLLLKEYAYPLLAENQVVIDVTELSPEERQQIVYNHIRMGDQPEQFRSKLKPHLQEFSEQIPFRPEVARRLGRRAFTHELHVHRASIAQFMAKPNTFLRDVFEGLDQDLLAALAIVYQAKELPASFDPSTDERSEVLIQLGSSPPKVNKSLSALKDTFLRCAPLAGSFDNDQAHWSFRHPTLREGFAAFMAEDPTLTKTLIKGLPDSDLFMQLDCGSGNAKGTLIVVPSSLYELVANRVFNGYESLPHSWYRDDILNYFLANRTSKKFLKTYLCVDVNLIDRCCEKLYSYLSATSQLSVLATLRSMDLLPEESRQRTLAVVGRLAVDTPDADWLDLKESAILFSDTERSALLDLVREKLIPNLDDTVFDWEMNEQGENADQYYAALEEALQRYILVFNTDKKTRRALQKCSGLGSGAKVGVQLLGR